MSALSLVVLVTGGRDFNDYRTVDRELCAIGAHLDGVIHGACRTGADLMAQRWCEFNGVQPITLPALWDFYRKAGKRGAAGPIRNTALVALATLCHAYRVIAFPGGEGTADCVRKARAAGLEVREVRE